MFKCYDNADDADDADVKGITILVTFFLRKAGDLIGRVNKDVNNK